MHGKLAVRVNPEQKAYYTVSEVEVNLDCLDEPDPLQFLLKTRV